MKTNVDTTEINDSLTHEVVDICISSAAKNITSCQTTLKLHVVVDVPHQASPRPCWSPPGRYPPYLLGGRTQPQNASTTDTPVRLGRLATGRRCPEMANQTSVTATSTPWPSSDGRCSSSR